ncbi:MAG: DUF1269 domain-containing protein [Desulfobacterales bacterium]
MPDLIIKTSQSLERAENIRKHINRVMEEKGVDLEESVIVEIDNKHRVHFHHSHQFTFPGALSGGFLGFLAGLIIINPLLALFGGIVGGIAGAAVGATEDIGLDEGFMRRLADELRPGTSALFLIFHGEHASDILGELEKFDGKVMKASLAHTDEQKLKQMLSEKG